MVGRKVDVSYGRGDERAAAGPEVVVVWGERPLRVAIDISARTKKLDIVLRLEDGSTREHATDVASLPASMSAST